MKTLTKIISLACIAVCLSCIGTAKTIRPTKNYQTVKRNIGKIESVYTSSSIDFVYHQTNGNPYIEIYASDNLMEYIVVKETGGKLTAYYENGITINGTNRCRIDIYAPDITDFSTKASGDISIPEGIITAGDIKMSTQASGNIECKSLKCKNLMAETCASGDIDIISTDCSLLQTEINASGDFEAKEVICRTAALSINASGDCNISRLQCESEFKGTINASGDMEISGYSPKAILRNNASGNLEAENFIAEEVEAEAYGSGDISCHASNAITAKTFGSGSIIYYGNPDEVNVKGKNVYKR